MKTRPAEPLGNGRWRYTISFLDGGRTQAYTSPPTTIELLQGPVDHLANGELLRELEFDLLNEALRLSTIRVLIVAPAALAAQWKEEPR